MSQFLKHAKRKVSLIGFCSISSIALAESPWLPAPQSGNVSLSYIYTTADEFRAGENKTSLPEDLEQHNALLNLEYGITDRLAIDFSFGYARTEFVEDAVLSPSASFDGIIDPKLGVRYKLWDELEDGGITFTVHSAAIFGGGYNSGALNSIGEDAFGLEFSGIAGKVWENGLGVSTELGFRYREGDIPDEFFANANAFYSLASLLNLPITLNVNYQMVDALSGIDIGSPGFNPGRFRETEEDYHIISGGLSYNFANSLSVNANYGEKVFGGRNTAASRIVSVGMSYGF